MYRVELGSTVSGVPKNGVISPTDIPFRNLSPMMRWESDAGHVPRGFYGALGALAEVELILVFAESGDPHQGQQYAGLQIAFDYAGDAFGASTDLFHRNVRSILDGFWLGLTLEVAPVV